MNLLKVKEEYEIQHYGFPLRQLSLEHQLLVKIRTNEAVKIFTDKLITKIEDTNASNEAIESVRSNIDSTSENIFKSFKENFKEFDDLTEKHLKIPDNIMLPEDFKNEKISLESEEDLINHNKYAEETFKQNSFLLIAMKNELEMYKKLQPTIDRENEISDEVKIKLNQHIENFGKVNEISDRIKRIVEFK